MSLSTCFFLTCIQVSQKTGKAVQYSHLFENFPHLGVIHTVKGFNIVNEAEVDVFLEFPCFLHDLADVGNLILCSSAFSKSSLNIWNFSVHILFKPCLKDFENYLASMCQLLFLPVHFLFYLNCLSFLIHVPGEAFVDIFYSLLVLLMFSIVLLIYFTYILSKLYCFLPFVDFGF